MSIQCAQKNSTNLKELCLRNERLGIRTPLGAPNLIKSSFALNQKNRKPQILLAIIKHFFYNYIMKYKIVYKATDRLLKEAVTLDGQVFSKKDVGDLEMCKKWLEK